ncbi:glycoside hydrolase family 2 protein [Actinospica sp.]|uniref:glycoside hydrolase family 2 protein n=1 Tax=Actinospica sp. TaxID=1872142 RepID=UPI002B9A07F6|nr:sugar-binding domain-containing protein [Actinospica sp.]HWG24156.1 glycoside hydrolase family 2 TIM barrel-domain containing protein [Actinospica sp.]
MSSVRPEYPRPHFDRSHAWLSLNGEWDFARDPDGSADPEQLAGARSWSEQIVVPFAWETEASGLGAQWLEYGWYRRTLTVPRDWAGQRVVLHFGAVHHEAEVWVNATRVGGHEGGYTPFEFDITEALGDGGAGDTGGDGAPATLLVRVWAPVDKREIVHGKQRSIPRDVYDVCAFTPSSGIWQPVWLEARPATYLSGVALTPAPTLDAVIATISVTGPQAPNARLTVSVGGSTVESVALSADPTAEPARASAELTVAIVEPHLWSPEDPHLYPVTVRLDSSDGADRVVSATGLRRVETRGSEIWLNGERVYLRGVLDQGYWPRTGMTAPDDQAFVADLELAREAGFNLVRKHLKLEDPRFLHHADRLGMLVWAEPASTGVFTPAAVSRFEAQIEPMVRRDGNHPSVVVWGLYNEEWGLDWDVAADPEKQQAVRHAYELLKALDTTRPAVDDSGWSHVATDLVDWHIYDETPRGWAEKVRALLERGETTFPVGLGPDLVVDKRLMAEAGAGAPADVPNLNSEFGGGVTSVERGWNLRWQTLELRRYDQLSGYVWTELYDIEHETAGIYSFERTLKDTGANPPAMTNAVTVVIPEVEPHAPGIDLVAGNGGEVEFSVRISHYGPGPVEVSLVPVWSSPLAVDARPEAGAGDRSTLKVHPFRLSAPVPVSTALPDGAKSARLHLLLVAAGEVMGRTVVDVTA